MKNKLLSLIHEKKTWFYLLKVLIAGIAATLIAVFSGLSSASSAGIVGILTILPTRRETVKTALERSLAFLLALSIAYLCFLPGYSIYYYLLFLTLYLTVCVLMAWYASLVMNAVLISHFINNPMTAASVLNETGIFLIGVVIGILLNLTLIPRKAEERQRVKDMDDEIQHILSRISGRLRQPGIEDFDGHCLDILSAKLEKAKELEAENEKNSFRKDTRRKEYLRMRESQYHVLTELVYHAQKINTDVDTVIQVSDFVLLVSEEYHEDNDVQDLLSRLADLHKQMDETALPLSWEEFEQRARLFVLLEDLEDFLNIKRKYMLRTK